MIKATQNVHLQLTVETNPEMEGANCGATVVAFESLEWYSCPKTQTTYSHTKCVSSSSSSRILVDIGK